MIFLPLQFSSPASLIRFFIYRILPTLFLPSAADVKKILPPTVFDLIFFNYQRILPPYSILNHQHQKNHKRCRPYLSSILKFRIDKNKN
ncbi:hypothetical protein HanPSC8_Chr17g0754261 [Helianthus annuus]|nr:hypothetical protein HanPSC8_Chr17g0754261 [Helianthus annuus]